MLKLLHVGLSANGEPLNGLQKAFIKKFHYREIASRQPLINEHIVATCNDFKPDIVFIQVQQRNIVSIEAVEHARKLGAFVINWTGDVRSPIPSWYEEFGRHIDLTCFSNVNDVETLCSRGIKSDFLQIGYDPEIYSPPPFKSYHEQPILFLANNSGTKFPLSEYRAYLAKTLRQTYKTQFGLYGNGWGELSNGSYYGDQLGEARLYQGGKIAINVSHFEYKRYSSDRLFRILGSGIFCLCKKYPEVEIDFQDGIDLVLWETEKELLEKIDYYMDENNQVERQMIAYNGWQKALKNHTFDSMINDIHSLYLKHTNNNA
jgi:hypothetical protein